MIGVLLLGGPLLVSASPAYAEALRPVADLGVSSTDRVIVVPSTHRFISIGDGNPFLRLSVFDADSFRLIRSVELNGYFPQPQENSVARIFALDEASRLLHLVVYSSTRDQGDTTNPKLLTVNVDTLAPVGQAKDLSLFPPGIRIYGAALWSPHRLGLIGQFAGDIVAPQVQRLPAPRFFGVVVGEIDPVSGATTWGPTPVRGCQKVISSLDQAAFALSGDRAFFACGTGSAGIFTAPGNPAVVSIDVTNPSDQKFQPLPGSYADGDSFIDPIAQRLLVVGRSGDRPSQSVWVFDIEHGAFVGQVAAGDFAIGGAGVDPSTGLLYVTIGRNNAAGALLVSRDRGTDVPQARSFGLEADRGPITSVPASHAIIVPIGDEKGNTLRVFRAPISAQDFSESRTADPRAYDAIAAEGPEYAGDAQAFSVRVHEVGGVAGVLQNAFYSDTWAVIISATRLKDGDRDIYLARVNRAHLSQDEASAAAIAADRDANTDADYETITEQTRGIPSEKWPFPEAACNDFGSGAKPEPVDGASVSCAQKDGRAEGSATYVAVDSPQVSVGASSSTASVRLDPALGLVSEAASEVRNVIIGEQVTISRIASVARVVAKGVPGSASATYTPVFEGVTAGSFSCSTQCDVTKTLEAISTTLGSQFRVELPASEVVATPGGAHAHAFREPWQHQQDVVIANQDPTELQVPALRITYIGDNAVASRAVLEFAATSAIATDLRIGPATKDDEGPPISILPPVVTVQPPPLPTVETPPPDGGGLVRKVLRVLGRPWGLTFALGPRTFALWMLLAVPLLLLARRRQLLRVTGLRR